MLELVDRLDLKSSDIDRVGSNPSSDIYIYIYIIESFKDSINTNNVR